MPTSRHLNVRSPQLWAEYVRLQLARRKHTDAAHPTLSPMPKASVDLLLGECVCEACGEAFATVSVSVIGFANGRRDGQ